MSAVQITNQHPLTVDNAIDYLLTHGIVGPDRILSGDLRVTEAPRRNRNLLIWIDDDRGFVIKQPEPTEPSTADTLTCEARFYQRHNFGENALLSGIVPKFVAFDASRSILTIELVCNRATMSEVCVGTAPHEFPIALWRRLGATVAAVHNISDSEALPSARRSGEPPWAFHAHRPWAESMRSQSAASLHALSTIQSAPALIDCFAVSLSSWEASALIHGDLRFDNILTSAASGSADLKLLDWELCQRGDPAWDVAWIIAGLVRVWLHTVDLGDPGDNDFAVEQSNWSVYQAAIRSFWFGYCAAQGAPIVGAKLARFTALALVQNVLESERYARHLTGPAILALQLCENIAVDPQRAADDFFALSAPDLGAS